MDKKTIVYMTRQKHDIEDDYYEDEQGEDLYAEDEYAKDAEYEDARYEAENVSKLAKVPRGLYNEHYSCCELEEEDKSKIMEEENFKALSDVDELGAHWNLTDAKHFVSNCKDENKSQASYSIPDGNILKKEVKKLIQQFDKYEETNKSKYTEFKQKILGSMIKNMFSTKAVTGVTIPDKSIKIPAVYTLDSTKIMFDVNYSYLFKDGFIKNSTSSVRLIPPSQFVSDISIARYFYAKGIILSDLDSLIPIRPIPIYTKLLSLQELELSFKGEIIIHEVPMLIFDSHNILTEKTVKLFKTQLEAIKISGLISDSNGKQINATCNLNKKLLSKMCIYFSQRARNQVVEYEGCYTVMKSTFEFTMDEFAIHVQNALLENKKILYMATDIVSTDGILHNLIANFNHARSKITLLLKSLCYGITIYNGITIISNFRNIVSQFYNKFLDILQVSRNVDMKQFGTECVRIGTFAAIQNQKIFEYTQSIKPAIINKQSTVQFIVNTIKTGLKVINLVPYMKISIALLSYYLYKNVTNYNKLIDAEVNLKVEDGTKLFDTNWKEWLKSPYKYLRSFKFVKHPILTTKRKIFERSLEKLGIAKEYLPYHSQFLTKPLLIPAVGTFLYGRYANDESAIDGSVKNRYMCLAGPANIYCLPTKRLATNNSVFDAIEKRLTPPIFKHRLLYESKDIIDVSKKIITWIAYNMIIKSDPLYRRVFTPQEFLSILDEKPKKLKFSKIYYQPEQIPITEFVDLKVKNEIYGSTSSMHFGEIATKPLRFVCDVSSHLLINTHIIAYSIMQFMKHNTSNCRYISGLNNIQMGNTYAEFIKDKKYVYSNDFSSYEGTQNQYSFALESRFFEIIALFLGYSNEQISKANQDLYQLAITPLRYEKLVIKRDFIRRSGSPTTSMGNSIYNMLATILAICTLKGKFDQSVLDSVLEDLTTGDLKFMVQGDDILIATDNDLSVAEFTIAFAKLGLVAKLKQMPGDPIDAAKAGTPHWFLGGIFIPIKYNGSFTYLHMNKPMNLLNSGGYFKNKGFKNDDEYACWLISLEQRYDELLKFKTFENIVKLFKNRIHTCLNLLEFNVDGKNYKYFQSVLKRYSYAPISKNNTLDFDVTLESEKFLNIIYPGIENVAPNFYYGFSFNSRQLSDLNDREAEFGC